NWPYYVARHFRRAGGAGQGRKSRPHRRSGNRPGRAGAQCRALSGFTTTLLRARICKQVAPPCGVPLNGIPRIIKFAAPHALRECSRAVSPESLRPARRWSERPPMDAKTPPEHGTNTKSAQLTIGEKNYSFPMYEGTVGPEVIDISKLYGEAGVF